MYTNVFYTKASLYRKIIDRCRIELQVRLINLKLI